MSFKPIVFTGLFFNFLFLLLLTEHKTWKSSTHYSRYLSRFSVSKPGLYCFQVDQMSPSPSKQIQIDDQMATIHLKSLQSKIPDSSIKYFSKSFEQKSQLFYSVESSWPESFRIGQDFLCEGQAYNHIVGSHKISINFQDTNSLKSYKRTDLTSRVIQVYDLSQVTQCEDFLIHSQGDWYLKNHDDLQMTSEIKEKDLIDFKNKLKCPEFNKFAVKKHITSEFIQKHYVLIFTEPYSVYYTKARYEFEFNGEEIIEEIISSSFSEEMLKGISDNIEHTLWHFFRFNLRSVLNHPRSFELFEVSFLLDHNFHPWLVDVINFQKLGQRPLESNLHLSVIDLAYSLLLGVEDNYIDTNVFNRIY